MVKYIPLLLFFCACKRNDEEMVSRSNIASDAEKIKCILYEMEIQKYIKYISYVNQTKVAFFSHDAIDCSREGTEKFSTTEFIEKIKPNEDFHVLEYNKGVIGCIIDINVTIMSGHSLFHLSKQELGSHSKEIINGEVFLDNGKMQLIEKNHMFIVF